MDYAPKNASASYLKYLNENECSFIREEDHGVNYRGKWCMFSVASQHVYGDSVEECIDNAIQMLGGK